MVQERIVAVGLLTQRHVEVLGTSLNHLWPIDAAPCFSQLLGAIDNADRQLLRELDQTSVEIKAT